MVELGCLEINWRRRDGDNSFSVEADPQRRPSVLKPDDSGVRPTLKDGEEPRGTPENYKMTNLNIFDQL